MVFIFVLGPNFVDLFDLYGSLWLKACPPSLSGHLFSPAQLAAPHGLQSLTLGSALAQQAATSSQRLRCEEFWLQVFSWRWLTSSRPGPLGCVWMCNVSLTGYLRDFTKRAGLRIGSSASRLFISFVVPFMQVLPTGFLGPQQEQGPVSVRFAWHPRSPMRTTALPQVDAASQGPGH